MRKTSQKFCRNQVWFLRMMLAAILLYLPLLSFPGSSTLSAKVVTGKVTSATDNEPLIGVTVKVDGSSNGTVTDFDGAYKINANPGQTLVFSYIGYLQQTVKIGGQNVINVKLQEDSKSLDEVVVVGYGVQKKKLVTGATVQLKGESISKLNTNNALQAMQGQTPGVNIISSSGEPGASMKVIIRGQGSNKNNDPLYVVDGIPGVDIKNINPSDIQSIDVLKDAASAAIYGAQAANGVVIVTTRNGRDGKAQVTFDGYMGWQSAARKIKLCGAREYMLLMDEQNVNSGEAVYDWNDRQKYASIYDADGNLHDTDWMDQMFKDNAKTESYVLGVSGGSATSTYAVSLGYYDQEGILGGKDASDYQRYNFRTNLTQKLYGDFLTIGENVSMAYTKSVGQSTGNMYNNNLRGAYSTTPLQPVYLRPGREDKNNGYSYSESSDWYQYDGNPVATLYRNRNLTDAQNWVANVYAEIQPVKNLKIKTQLGFNHSSSDYRRYEPLFYSTSNTNKSTSTVAQNQYKGWTLTWTNTAAYNFNVREHAFETMIGMESERFQGTQIDGSNSLLSLYDTWNNAYLSNATSKMGTVTGAPKADYRRVSYFGRAGWNWKETYMMNVTLRCDGSSRFAEGHRFGWFPSVSAGWVITNESFMKPVASVLDFFKLRASWGQVGNNNIGDFMYTTVVTKQAGDYNFGTGKGDKANSNGTFPSRIGTDDLKWETSEQTNVGFDARLFAGKLSVNFDWYLKKTKDWIVEVDNIATVGTEKKLINGGDVSNKGVELGLAWNDKIGKDFSYNIGANFAYNKNEVKNIPTEGGIIQGSTNVMFNNQTEFYRCSDGHAMGYFWGYRTEGLFQNQQEIDDWVAAGNGILPKTAPGDIKVVDMDHNGVIDDNDKIDLGNGIPKYNFGFNLGFTYRQFDFSTTWSGAAGFKVANGGYRNWGNASKSNYTTYFLGRWTGEGTSNDIPRLTTDDHNWTNFSDIYLQNGDYLRIANITVGYDFAKLIGFKYLSQLRLYAQVQNLYTFTKYNGMDPEVGFGQDAWVSGIDTGSYPHSRTFLVGVNVKF